MEPKLNGKHDREITYRISIYCAILSENSFPLYGGKKPQL